jgi:hypothetical protein
VKAWIEKIESCHSNVSDHAFRVDIDAPKVGCRVFCYATGFCTTEVQSVREGGEAVFFRTRNSTYRVDFLRDEQGSA